MKYRVKSNLGHYIHNQCGNSRFRLYTTKLNFDMFETTDINVAYQYVENITGNYGKQTFEVSEYHEI